MDSRKAGYAYLTSLTPAELHKKLMNYYLCQKGIKQKNKCQTDYDIIQKNHKFLWEEEDKPITWEENLAKRYYDKLYKEYCICDLSLYKMGKVAMRWRTEQELIKGKGQFICGNKLCREDSHLTSWEVNFAYIEQEEKKNALVKLRLCPDCSSKLNYKCTNGKFRNVNRKLKTKPYDIKKKLKKTEHKPNSENDVDNQSSQCEDEERAIWKTVNRDPLEEKSREEDFENFLSHMLL